MGVDFREVNENVNFFIISGVRTREPGRPAKRRGRLDSFC